METLMSWIEWIFDKLNIFRSHLKALTLVLVSCFVATVPALLPDEVKYQTGKPVGLITRLFLLSAVILVTYQYLDLRDKWKNDPENLGRSRFIDFYTRTLEDAFALIQDFPNYQEENFQLAVEGLLKSICSVIETYYKKQNLNINANLMRNIPIDSKQLKDFPGIHLVDFKRLLNSYESVLEIIAWADDNGNVPKFSLPVDSDPDRILFGAPKAIKTLRIQVVKNISSRSEINKLLIDHPKAVKEAAYKYGENRNFKSFISIPIVGNNGEGVGVLNIQSSQKNLFGSTEAHCEELERYIRPFRAMLSLMIKSMHNMEERSREAHQ